MQAKTPDGLKIAVHEYGGDGPPMLLAHPTGFHGRVWDPVAEALVTQGRRVWSFDFRGHGDSDRAVAYAWPDFATDVLAVVDALGIAGSDLVGAGNSKGATALLLAEARAPGTFGVLWCYEPIIFPPDFAMPDGTEVPLSTIARKRRATWGSTDEAFASYASRPPLDAFDEASLRAYVEHGLTAEPDGTRRLKCAPEDEAQMYALGIESGAWDALASVRIPVTVLAGGVANPIPVVPAEQIAQRLAHGRAETWDDHGHFGPFEDPTRTARVLARLHS